MRGALWSIYIYIYMLKHNIEWSGIVIITLSCDGSPFTFCCMKEKTRIDTLTLTSTKHMLKQDFCVRSSKNIAFETCRKKNAKQFLIWTFPTPIWLYWQKNVDSWPIRIEKPAPDYFFTSFTKIGKVSSSVVMLENKIRYNDKGFFCAIFGFE